MQMRPRNYSFLNRAIARGVGHAVNDAYRRKERQRKYNNIHNINNVNSNNNHYNSSDNNSTSDGTLALTIIACILVGLAIAI